MNGRMWGARDVGWLRDYMSQGMTLKEAAKRNRRSVADCDLALWLALGRTDGEAAQIINRSNESSREGGVTSPAAAA